MAIDTLEILIFAEILIYKKSINALTKKFYIDINNASNESIAEIPTSRPPTHPTENVIDIQ